MGEAPDDVRLLEFCDEQGLNPQTVRDEWSVRDLNWIFLIRKAKSLALEELSRRGKENG